MTKNNLRRGLKYYLKTMWNKVPLLNKYKTLIC
jgi:hypothetical protein